MDCDFKHVANRSWWAFDNCRGTTWQVVKRRRFQADFMPDCKRFQWPIAHLTLSLPFSVVDDQSFNVGLRLHHDAVFGGRWKNLHFQWSITNLCNFGDEKMSKLQADSSGGRGQNCKLKENIFLINANLVEEVLLQVVKSRCNSIFRKIIDAKFDAFDKRQRPTSLPAHRGHSDFIFYQKVFRIRKM